MSTFTLAISCLATSNLPWFIDLTFHFLCNIALYRIELCFCHQSHPQLGGCFCFGSVSLSFLELFPHWSPVAYWAFTDLGSSSFSVLSFCLFILFILDWFAIPSPVDHILSELSTMIHPSQVALHGMALSFIELDKAAVHVIRLVSFPWLWFSVCLPSDGEG